MSSISEFSVLNDTLSYSESLERSKKLRRDIKNKKIIFDETRVNFGLVFLKQLHKVSNTSEIKGYPFVGKGNSGDTYGIKIIMNESKYSKHEHPSNIEYIILKELTDNIVYNGISPHVVNYLGIQKINNNCRALKYLNLKSLEIENCIKKKSTMLISEYMSEKSLRNYIKKTYENGGKISHTQWISIVFQIMYTLQVLQEKYKLVHNDLHYDNILMAKTKKGGYLVYTIKNQVFYTRNYGVIPAIWDTEFTMVYSNSIKDFYPNKFVTNEFEYDYKNQIVLVDKSSKYYKCNQPYYYNQYYDLHFFLTSLLELHISQELFDWIISIYPNEVIPDDSTTTSDDSLTESHDSQSILKTSTESASASVSRSRSDSDSSSDSASESELESGFTVAEPDAYILKSRLINGAEDRVKLPKPDIIFTDSFFDKLKVKPADFDEDTAIYFSF